ncbi:MAG: hypothetical protein CMJ34_11540 [Phycisphaerae bacterium]|jgi:hypothetical protein|nr:hypothetical protein [Phycisphaerae bacterium]
MTSLPAQSDASEPGGSSGETATVGSTSAPSDLTPRERDLKEMDAGVVLFGIVLLLLLGIPFTVAMFRFRMARRSGDLGRGTGLQSRIVSESRESRDFGASDPWEESARRVEVDPGEDEVR